MSYENDLQEIIDKLTLSNDDRQSYTEDADEIRDYIIERMKKSDDTFAKYFDGTSLTGSYLDRLKIEQPDEFDIDMKLKLPYPIRIIDASKYPGSLCLLAVNQTHGSMITDPYADGYCISREKLQNWIRHIINSIFKGNPLVFQRLNSGRTYRVVYCGNTVAHTFTATDQNNKNRVISFDLVPSFEFANEEWVSPRKNIHGMPWFAVPSPKYPDSRINHFIFKISAPHQERELLKDKNNLKNVIRLLKAIKDHNNMPKLASYWIKTVFLWEIEKHNDEFWDQTNGILLIHMLRRLIQCFEANNIPFYWNQKSNLLDRLQPDQKISYLQKLKEILQKLDNNIQNKSNQDIAKIFGC